MSSGDEEPGAYGIQGRTGSKKGVDVVPSSMRSAPGRVMTEKKVAPGLGAPRRSGEAGASLQAGSMRSEYDVSDELEAASWKTASLTGYSWKAPEPKEMAAELTSKADDLERQAAELRAAAQNCRDMANVSAFSNAYAVGQPPPGGGYGMMMPPPGVLMSMVQPGMVPQMSAPWPVEGAVAAMPNLDKTTAMWRNLPNNYSRDDLIMLINTEGFGAAYDFFYSPIDFKSNALLGYAFINFVSAEEATRFYCHFQGFTRWSLTSEKVSEVTWSDPLQGLQGHIERYRNSPVMHEDIADDKKPLLFSNGTRIAFPAPTKKIRAPHVRGCLQKVKAPPRH